MGPTALNMPFFQGALGLLYLFLGCLFLEWDNAAGMCEFVETVGDPQQFASFFLPQCRAERSDLVEADGYLKW
jgi:hypothetical protein